MAQIEYTGGKILETTPVKEIPYTDIAQRVLFLKNDIASNNKTIQQINDDSAKKQVELDALSGIKTVFEGENSANPEVKDWLLANEPENPIVKPVVPVEPVVEVNPII